MTNSLVTLERASQMLAEVKSIDDAKTLIDLAEAARVYARQIDLGLKAQNHAAEIKLRAQRRAGEILGAMDKNVGTRGRLENFNPSGGSVVNPPEDQPPTYDDLGISKFDAHNWRSVAILPDYKFEDYIESSKESGREITTAGVVREANKHKNEQDLEESRDYKIPLTDGEKNRLVGRFMAGMIIRAIKDAAGDTVEYDDDEEWEPEEDYEECTPVEFLTHEMTPDYCKMGGINYELIKAWVDMGCPTYRLHEWLCEKIRKQADEHLAGGKDYG